MFGVLFDFFFFVLELKCFFHKNCEFVEVKTVVICFEVDIILSIIAIIDIVSSADMDVANIRFFCYYSFVNIKT